MVLVVHGHQFVLIIQTKPPAKQTDAIGITTFAILNRGNAVVSLLNIHVHKRVVIGMMIVAIVNHNKY